MLKKNHWAIPGFTCLAMLSLSACGGSAGGPGGTPGTGTGGGGTTAVDFTVPNVYADFGNDTARKIGTLTVFGDSYSDHEARNNADFDTWSERMVSRASNGTLDSYAKGEASANGVNVYYKVDPTTGVDPDGDDPDNTFNNQVDRFEATGRSFGSNDLTVVYMGYNDVNVLWDNKLNSALDDYETELDRLLDAGAAKNDRKVFLTLIHDWDSTPKELARFDRDTAPGGLCDRKSLSDEECHYKRQRTIEWNQRLVDIANANDNVIAVDLFTVIERVLANPSKFGFVDVTSAGGANAVDGDATHLYFDSVHFGGHGQEIVAQVMNHYLTRGWDWANTLAAGSAAAAQIGRDIENGLLLGLSSLTPEQRLGLNSFVMGDGIQQSAAKGSGARSSFEEMQGSGKDDLGVGLNYAFSDQTMMGVAISNSQDGSNQGSELQSSRLESESTSVAFYFNTEAAGLKFRTVASFSDDSHRRTEHDGLIDATNAASFGGETMAISQTASLPMQVGSNWFTPWVSFSHTVQQLDSYTISNPYLSDTTYKGDAVSETYATIGLSTESGGIEFGDAGALKFNARMSYSQSLALDDYRVSVREEALGYAEDTVIRREDQGVFGLRVGADLAIDEKVSLSAGYEVNKQSDAEAQQSVQLRLNYRF